MHENDLPEGIFAVGEQGPEMVYFDESGRLRYDKPFASDYPVAGGEDA
jgi:hypothetical protein